MTKSFAEIKANHEKLENCKRHLFMLTNEQLEEGLPFGLKLFCNNCNGEMNAIHAMHYIKGYEAAGCNPNDVMPGYK